VYQSKLYEAKVFNFNVFLFVFSSNAELNRRDDVESLAYVLIYFALGRLPWQGIEAQSRKQRYDKIMESKMNIKMGKLCHGLPNVFGHILQYSRSLSFSERPSYASLSRLLVHSMPPTNYREFIYDWEPLLKVCS
jgi:hypothetical protein